MERQQRHTTDVSVSGGGDGKQVGFKVSVEASCLPPVVLFISLKR